MVNKRKGERDKERMRWTNVGALTQKKLNFSAFHLIYFTTATIQNVNDKIECIISGWEFRAYMLRLDLSLTAWLNAPTIAHLLSCRRSLNVSVIVRSAS